MESIGELLKRARSERHWTQGQVADKLDTNEVTISRWENSIVVPGKYFQQKLCELYQMTPEQLGFGGNGREVPKQNRPVFLFNWTTLPALEEFYGREKGRKKLVTRTIFKASTSITGPRRIGKTWLLLYLLAVAPREAGANLRIGYLDCMTPECATVEGFVAKALQQLGQPRPQRNEGLLSLEQGLQRLASQKLAPVLCIDEFDYIGHNEQFARGFYEGLRSLCSSPDIGLVLVTASREPLYQITRRNAQGSPFFNIFERLDLKPFNYSETETFIAEKSRAAQLTPQESKYLWDYGRLTAGEQVWWPLRLQLAGTILEEEEPRTRRLPNYRDLFEEQFLLRYEATIK